MTYNNVININAIKKHDIPSIINVSIYEYGCEIWKGWVTETNMLDAFPVGVILFILKDQIFTDGCENLRA